MKRKFQHHTHEPHVTEMADLIGEIIPQLHGIGSTASALVCGVGECSLPGDELRALELQAERMAREAEILERHLTLADYRERELAELAERAAKAEAEAANPA